MTITIILSLAPAEPTGGLLGGGGRKPMTFDVKPAQDYLALMFAFPL